MIKRIIPISFLVLFFFSADMFSQGLPDTSALSFTPVLTESFDNNSNNWITGNSYLSGSLKEGQYVIKCKNYKGSTGLSAIPVLLDQGKDYEIEGSIRIINGSGGLLFGMNDKYDHYRIEFNNKNDLFVVKDTPSKSRNEILLTSPGNKALKQSTVNKITIAKYRGSCYVYVNGVFIKEFKNIVPDGNKVGFNVGKNSEISVEYLKVSYLSEKTKPTLADTKRPEKALPSNGLVIEWISPSGLKTPLENFSAKVKVKITSTTGLKEVLFYINGVASRGESDIRSSSDEQGVFTVEKLLSLGQGENSVYIVANNSEGSTRSELRYFTNPDATAPVVTWKNPEDPKTTVNTVSFNVEACIKSSTDLRSVKILVNGIPLIEDVVFQRTSLGECDYLWQAPVILKDGDNTVFIVAANAAGSKSSEERIIKLESSDQEKRIALVIGNAKYGNRPSLKNPENDANLMAATLKEMNFEVIKRLNASKNDMEAAIREFTEKLPYNSVALFYYAGHGNQVDGTNYLIPTDAVLENRESCQFEAIKVDFIVSQFERYQRNTNIVILDACRDNPYASWERGSQQGFRAMSFSNGTIISFATSEGATAADGNGSNGLFTEELVQQMYIPQTIENVFKKTRIEVSKKSSGRQVPQEWTKLVGDFFFIKEK